MRQAAGDAAFKQIEFFGSLFCCYSLDLISRLSLIFKRSGFYP
jgi:hypothetical protein